MDISLKLVKHIIFQVEFPHTTFAILEDLTITPEYGQV